MDAKDRLWSGYVYGIKNGFDYIFDSPLVRRVAGTSQYGKYSTDVYTDKDSPLEVPR